MRFLNNWLIFCLMLLTSGCALFERSPNSGNQAQRTNTSSKLLYAYFGDSKNAMPVNPKVQLKMLESALSTNREIEQYSKLLPLFADDQEKIEFLKNGDFESKQAWIRESQILNRNQAIQASMQNLIDNRDIALKMPANLVIKSWGEPDAIEVSGNPKFKNERWTYRRMVPQADGFKKEVRTVYIESGVVAGWEVE